MALLRIEHLNRRFGGLQAVSDVSLTLSGRGDQGGDRPERRRQDHPLQPDIAGILAPTSGRGPLSAARRSRDCGRTAIARLGMARTFQNIKLFAGMTALENVMVGRHVQSQGRLSRRDVPPALVPCTEERAIREEIDGALDFLGIADLRRRRGRPVLPSASSGPSSWPGPWPLEPALLLLDEPAAGLNIYETAEVGRLIGKIRDLGITVLLVEHDMSLVMDISDEIVVLSFGQKIAEDVPPGDPEQPGSDQGLSRE